ncbi:transcription factor IIA, alpha/beta subunit [Gamsiella multidivaricata]|uniref:transcription factor IIA, alpha/beta subunit n=1 Tax=Gamsiella multidivaricata TaxID=101098 RepID=UPI00221EE0B0|nr:transcription factor IIA, alpha/beta subunit [Gamsiella multidivaricata]KAI7828909.1 transcription factor IIA, alpha/beta subunit [Gamsiella multidivaricata]
MANNAVTAVYRFVIDDVITNVRRDFEDMGVDETIMHELQRSWETKIAQSKVVAFQPSESTAPAEPYEFDEYDQSAAASASASVPAVAPGLASYTAPPPPPGSFNYRVEQTPAANLANVASTTLPGDNSNVGRPQPHVPPRSTSGGKNISLPGGGRNGTTNSTNIPQTDGAADVAELEFMSTTELDAYVEKRFMEARETEQLTGQAPGEMTFTLTLSERAARKAKRDGLEGFTIGQVDGDHDEDDDTGLGSDLDDSDGDMDDESDNIVLCQYDKVSRTKSKWKCVLKDGIMLINGRDYLFHRANGDFEW